ncbi:MAG: hypothetical protein ABR540_10650 [Acidimicrobiales bacterium]
MDVRRKLFVGAAALVAMVAAVALGLFLSPSLHSQIKGSVTRQPTPFTELYFDDYASVPKDLIVDQPNLIHFAIANHENSAVTYRFVLIADGPGGARQVDDGQLRVPRGATGRATARFVPDTADARWVLSVQLFDRPESIHFAAAS